LQGRTLRETPFATRLRKTTESLTEVAWSLCSRLGQLSKNTQSRDGNCPIDAPVRPYFFQTSPPESTDPAIDLRAGISNPKAHIPPWYLYDEIGSRLFDVITLLPDYYPTRTEAAIIAEHLPEMAKVSNIENCTLIDLGAGSCDKAPSLFPLLKPRQYVPVDISVDHLRSIVTKLQREHEDIEMIGVGTDFSNNLALPDQVRPERRLFFYPGSSIGNFTPEAAAVFLRQVRSQMQKDGAIWIGIDLIKDPVTLERAYDDELGVTAAFNLNMLLNVNRIAGTNFEPAHWQHRALFNAEHSRIEMQLEAKAETTVRWPEGERTFSAGERIHTESSYKYTPDSFRALLEQSGLRPIGMWTDDQELFAVFAAVLA
jgi:dimethylhistidine N-methyltransferase